MSGQVMVFVPAPELTITIEQAGENPDIHLHAGGQGIWQARMIATLGVPVVLCTTFGGEPGQVLKTLIADEGLIVRAVQGDGKNGAYIHDRRDGDREEVAQAPGDPLTRHGLDELYGLALAEGLRSSVTLLSGTRNPEVIEPDAYRRLAGDLRRNGSVVIADLSGDYLTAVLESGLSFLKVSHEELVKDGRSKDDSTEALQEAMIDLHHAGADAVVVSRAEKPALALFDGGIFEVILPELEPADHHGAGDSMTAGVTATLAQGGDLRSAVRIGAAAGAVNVTRHGLGTGRASVIAALMDRVELRQLGTYERSSRPPGAASGTAQSAAETGERAQGAAERSFGTGESEPGMGESVPTPAERETGTGASGAAGPGKTRVEPESGSRTMSPDELAGEARQEA